MIDEKYRILESGVSIDDVTTLEEGVRKSLDTILEDMEYESEDIDKLEYALRDECYKHILQHANLDEDPSDEDIRSSFSKILRDFKGESYEDMGKSALSVLIGSRHSRNDVSDPKSVNRDIVYISDYMLRQNYDR